MHPLALLVTGLYGKPLPQQNGAPLRLVVPWKYGFKGIKSIVAINFVEKMPDTSWHDSQPSEYGFFSQRQSERRPPALEPEDRAPHRRHQQQAVCRTHPDAAVQRLRATRWPALYAGMDLRKWF